MLTEELTTAMLRVGGIAGIVVVGLSIAVVALWRSAKRERDQCEKEKAAVQAERVSDAQTAATQFLVLTEKAVAALTMSANAMAANTHGAAELNKAFDRLADELRRQSRR